VEALQDFVSARFADLTTAGGLTVRARQVFNAVTSAASSARGMPPATPITSRQPDRIVAGRDLPVLRRGVERC
jgi:hypothetical protein